MSTNSPFDVRIVNPLERPTSSDFNIAQAVERTTAQKVAGLALDMSNQDNPDAANVGFYGSGFQVVPGVGLTVRISPGMGFVWKRVPAAILNVDSIPGVDVYSTAEARPLVMDAPGKVITIPTLPSAGLMRRDVIAVKVIDEGTLADQITTDRFNPTQQVFTPQSAYKTYTWTLNAATVEVIPAGPSTTTAPLIYVQGPDAPYLYPDSFLAYGVPEIPAGYRILAVINIQSDLATITTSQICDYRRLFFPDRVLTFPISLTAGATIPAPPDPRIPGAALDFVPPYLPGGMTQPVITRAAKGTANVYQLYLPGFYNARSIAAALSVGGAITYSAEFACVVTPMSSKVPNDNPLVANLLSSTQVDALADSDLTMPVVNWAVGQPYSMVEFALGMLDITPPPGVYYNATSFNSIGSPTRTISGTVTLSY